MATKLYGQTDNCVNLLSELQEAEIQTDTLISSDGKSALVHSAIISKCSEFMCDLLSSINEDMTIILPGFSSVLHHFVTLVHTGSVTNISKQDTKLLSILCTELGMETSYEKIGIPTYKAKKLEDNECLKVETELFCESSQQFFLRLPKSRMELRKRNEHKLTKIFQGFKGRVQNEYNCSPVGPYEGPYDQNPEVPLCAQLSKSTLNYEKYTGFTHAERAQCKIFRIKSNYEEASDLRKIDTFEIDSEATDAFLNSEEEERVIYTCTKKQCRIPCPCILCNSEEPQCPQHNIIHRDLFNEDIHAISVRSVYKLCSKENFFWHSYILKYPGIPKDCLLCTKDLLHHKCYHLKFHWSCKFCKLYQYKLYPTTIEELHAREKREEKWYGTVCPFCDKKFSWPYITKRHIKLEHKDEKIKCEMCPKSFHSKQSLNYHNLATHTDKSPPSESCTICDKKFNSKVTLGNHIKLVHRDTDLFECGKCETKFKRKKYLDAHLLHVHGMDQKKEDYWQDLPRKYFKCETCKAEFIRKGDLKVHMDVKHLAQEINSCDLCPSKFKWKKDLQSHKLEKHGPGENKHQCPECGKMFNQRRNMKRHHKTHK